MSRWGDSAPKGDQYDARWKALEAAGHDPHGEASLVMTYAPRSVLDAGCGTGRVAIELARRGVDVVGVDIGEAMLDVARRKAPGLVWIRADLSTLALERRDFDVVVMAGNVMIFVALGSEPAVIERAAAHLRPGGFLIAGFQLDRGLTLADFDRHCSAAGLVVADRFATWDRDPWRAGGDYAVSVHVLA